MTKQPCTRNMPDEMHDADGQRKNHDGGVQKAGEDGRPDTGLKKGIVNDLPMNRDLNELEEHKNPNVDGTGDRRKMHQVSKMSSDCSS